MARGLRAVFDGGWPDWTLFDVWNVSGEAVLI